MREDEIRPDGIFAEYLRLARLDAASMLRHGAQFSEVTCPACDGLDRTLYFVKDGFFYNECGNCGSLFVSPRPSPALLADFYESSPSSLYWADVFWPAVADVRTERIIRPRVQRVLGSERIARLGGKFTAVDVGAGAGAFLHELRAASPSVNAIAVEPGPALAQQARARGLTVVAASSEAVVAWDAPADLVTSFEVIEHVHDPLAFVMSLHRFCRPGGTVLVTGLGGDGFDVRMLREESNAASVPHHLNFLSVRGFETLFKRGGFDAVHVETPGELDVEIVTKALARGAGLHVPDFIRVMLRYREPSVQVALQGLLRQSRMSSHTWVWATKPNTVDTVEDG